MMGEDPPQAQRQSPTRYDNSTVLRSSEQSQLTDGPQNIADEQPPKQHLLSSRDFALNDRAALKKRKPAINLDLSQLQEPASGQLSTARRVVLNKGSARNTGSTSMKGGVKEVPESQEASSLLLDTKIHEVPSNMTFDHPQGLVITGGDRPSHLALNENSEEQEEEDQAYARSTHFVPAASQMVLHLESDPNKKTMDFPANASNVPFFETELKDKLEPQPPLVSACVLDIEI